MKLDPSGPDRALSGKHGQPEIKGYTKEYLEASSPRREQIKDHLREVELDGAGAASIDTVEASTFVHGMT